MIDDRLTRGAVAGAIAAVMQNVYIYLVHLAGLTKLHYEDWAEALMFYKLQTGHLYSLLGFIGHLVWDAFLGIIFAYLIQSTSSRFLYWKGIIYGLFIWYITRVTATLIKLPMIDRPGATTTLVYLIGAVVYGLTAARILKLLDKAEI